MNRYHVMFDRLAKKQEGAFIPFTVLWDPNRETSKKIISTFIKAGADALELGIAFSDPLADGPTIQKADLRALKSGSSVSRALDLIKEIRDENPNIPIGVLTYANLVFKIGAEKFYQRCSISGVDSVLIADVPLLEAKPYCQMATSKGVDPVLIAPINLPLDRCQELAGLCRGYTYIVTRRGVTGANDSITFHHATLLKKLKECGAPPFIFGFGISKPEHVTAALMEGAAGVVCGSKIVALIEENLGDEEAMHNRLFSFVKTMKEASIKK